MLLILVVITQYNLFASGEAAIRLLTIDGPTKNCHLCDDNGLRKKQWGLDSYAVCVAHAALPRAAMILFYCRLIGCDVALFAAAAEMAYIVVVKQA